MSNRCRCSISRSFVWALLVDYFFFQAEDGIRDLVRSRGLGDVYKRQVFDDVVVPWDRIFLDGDTVGYSEVITDTGWRNHICLLYTSDAADERSSVDLGGRRIIKTKKTTKLPTRRHVEQTSQRTTVKEDMIIAST